MSATLATGAFFGRSAPVLAVGDVTLAETSYAPGFVVPLHDHAHPILCLGLAGHFTERVSNRRVRLGAGSVFFQPAGEAHAETFHDAPGRLFNVQPGAAWLGAMEAYGVRLPAEPLNVTGGRLSLLAAQLHSEYLQRDGALRLAVDGILLSVLAELTRATARQERTRRLPWLDAVVGMLHDRFRERIGLAELAAAAEIDPSHLAHTFRARMGCTVGEYVRALRVEHARVALAASDLPLSRVALDAGFADQSHMTRAVRAALGVTPAEYRRRVR